MLGRRARSALAARSAPYAVYLSALPAAAVLAGARSLAAVGEWAAVVVAVVVGLILGAF